MNYRINLQSPFSPSGTANTDVPLTSEEVLVFEFMVTYRASLVRAMSTVALRSVWVGRVVRVGVGSGKDSRDNRSGPEEFGHKYTFIYMCTQIS